MIVRAAQHSGGNDVCCLCGAPFLSFAESPMQADTARGTGRVI
jgi:hypothetical protein